MNDPAIYSRHRADRTAAPTVLLGWELGAVAQQIALAVAGKFQHDRLGNG